MILSRDCRAKTRRDKWVCSLAGRFRCGGGDVDCHDWLTAGARHDSRRLSRAHAVTAANLSARSVDIPTPGLTRGGACERRSTHATTAPYVGDRGDAATSMDDNNNSVPSQRDDNKLNRDTSDDDDEEAGSEGRGMPEKRERTAAEIRKVRPFLSFVLLQSRGNLRHIRSGASTNHHTVSRLT